MVGQSNGVVDFDQILSNLEAQDLGIDDADDYFEEQDDISESSVKRGRLSTYSRDSGPRPLSFDSLEFGSYDFDD